MNICTFSLYEFLLYSCNLEIGKSYALWLLWMENKSANYLVFENGPRASEIICSMENFIEFHVWEEKKNVVDRKALSTNSKYFEHNLILNSLRHLPSDENRAFSGIKHIYYLYIGSCVLFELMFLLNVE